MIFSEFRPWFNQRFSLLLDEKIALFSSHSHSADVSDIASYIKTLGGDGKRFRPFLVSVGAGEVDHDKHFLLYAAVELLHLFALIHDDIMDNADTRHGVLCAHTKFIPSYGSHTAAAIAILLGDVVFSWAYDCLMEYTKNNPLQKDRLHEEFSKLIGEVTHGQILDVISPQQPPLSEVVIIEKMTLKTARYTFVQPLKLGFIVKGDDVCDQQFADAFGVALGVAFQLQDDLLDSLGTDATGKSSFTDIQTKQQTVLSWYMEHRADNQYKNQFRTLFGTSTLTEENKETIVAILSQSGAIQYVTTCVTEYIVTAKNAIQQYQKDNTVIWEDIVALVESRQK